MHKFLRKTAVFAAICILIFALGELLVRNIPSSYSVKNDYLEQHSADINTLILGPSHMYYGIRPELLGDSVFNLANISQTPDYDLALLKMWLGKMPNLRKIYLSTSYCTFREGNLEEIADNLCNNYKVAMHLPLHSDFSKYNLVITDFNAWAGRLRSLVQHEDANLCDSLGFGLGFDLSTRSKAWEDKGLDRVQSLTLPPDSVRCNEVMRIFSEILSMAQSRSIQCTFVMTPAWHTFRQAADSIQLREAIDLTGQLATQFNADFINLYDSPLFVEEDFHDSDHLSDIGAAKFTALLKKM